MAHDPTTIDFYGQEVAAYTSRGQAPARRRLDAFLAALPPGASILELGCGAGQDSEYMIAKGFDVRPTDGTPAMAQAAQRRLGVPVATLLFGDLNEVGTRNGIWANACLLHTPRVELPAIIGRIHAALKAGGVFYASFKAGEAEGRDQFDRYYNYPSEGWLRTLYAALPWRDVVIEAEAGSGYDRKPTDWLHVTATRSDESVCRSTGSALPGA